MQASAILLFAVCLQASATGLGQTVSFTGKDVPLKTIFTAIKKQTGYGVFYQSGETATLEGTAPVTLDLKNVALDLFLQAALRNQPLEYSVEGSTIFIKKKEAHTLSVEVAPGASASEIHGRVTNDKGEPLVNANVTVKRTGRGTITDANGNFTLHNVNTDDVVTISFIGYKAQSIPIHDRTNFNVFMTPTNNDLDKVVVQAYGSTSQRLATGNIGVVRAEDIAKQPVMNVLQAVQGQVPGAVVTNTSGYASGTINVEIRGRNTLSPNFPSDPLYIIDGVPVTVLDVSNTSSYTTGSKGFIANGFASPANGQSPLFSLNPQDIESISVLKDADATAIYGSRGANGVILITTKKGTTGKTKLDISVYQGVSKTPRFYNMLNTSQYISMRKEALANDGLPVDMSFAPDLTVWDTTRYTNWQKYIFGGTGNVTDAQAVISGGDARTDFRFSAGYRKQRDIITSSGANQRLSFSLNLTHKTSDHRFSISLDASYSYTMVDLISLPSNAALLPPNAPSVFDKNGNLNYTGWTPLKSIFSFQGLLQPYNAKTNFLTTSATLSYEIIKGLLVRSTLGYNNIQMNQTSFTPIISQDPAFNPLGSSDFGYNFIHNLIIEPQIEYNSFIGKGKLNALAGFSRQFNKTDGLSTSGYGYTNDALLGSINLAPSKNVNDNFGEYKYAAIYGRLNFNWENEFILNVNGRRDGSSKFGPGRQFGNFWSVGGAWIFSEEKLMSRILPFLSLGKIRASYGITGNDQIGDYAFLSRWSSTGIDYNGILPLTPVGHSDSALQWEVNKKLEVAMELGFFQDRLLLQTVYYRNRCDDQLIFFPTPAFTGFSSVTANTPANVQNTGWEFTVSGRIIDKPKFKWSSKFSIGLNRNKLLAYPNLSQSPFADVFKIGQSLNVIKMLHYKGVDPQTGLYAFEDKNKDGQVSIDFSGQKDDDRHPVDLSTKYDGSFTTDFSYQNWGLDIFFYFRKRIAPNALLAVQPPGSIQNEPTSVLQHWQKPGDISGVARFTTNPYDPSYQNFLAYSDGTYTDASFIRLQNLSLSYTFPGKLINKINLNNCKIYIRGENIFIITKYKGVDPEVPYFGTLPMPRTITAGILCNF
ncbi:MAG TPA: SusC/RagA family TonB-linked outer membrane protein [Puia sp.]|nr:SusC/RagA family TonB-linked outer membrane protein [Puia sp.]